MLNSGSDRCFTGRLTVKWQVAQLALPMGASSVTSTPKAFWNSIPPAHRILISRVTEGQEDETDLCHPSGQHFLASLPAFGLPAFRSPPFCDGFEAKSDPTLTAQLTFDFGLSNGMVMGRPSIFFLKKILWSTFWTVPRAESKSDNEDRLRLYSWAPPSHCWKLRSD